VAVTIEPTSVINGAVNDYVISITPATPLINLDTVFFTFPPEVTLPGAGGVFPCTEDSTLITSMTCTRTGQVMKMTLGVAAGMEDTPFSVTIPGFKNPPSTEAVAVTLVEVKSTAGFDVNEYTFPISIQN
jgi:hypothetical protein